MRRKIFFACAALVVSVTAVVGVKAYNYYSMSQLMRANLEALSKSESYDSLKIYIKCKEGLPNDECGYQRWACGKLHHEFKKGKKIDSLSGACDRCCTPLNCNILITNI